MWQVSPRSRAASDTARLCLWMKDVFVPCQFRTWSCLLWVGGSVSSHTCLIDQSGGDDWENLRFLGDAVFCSKGRWHNMSSWDLCFWCDVGLGFFDKYKDLLFSHFLNIFFNSTSFFFLLAYQFSLMLTKQYIHTVTCWCASYTWK